MMNRDFVFLKHILKSSDYVVEFISDISFKNFNNPRIIQIAVIRELRQIGEATKNHSIDIRSKYTEIPWKEIAGMKDKLTHGYFAIDLK